MVKKTGFVSVVCVFFSLLCYGQEVGQVTTPASREDIQKLEHELRRMRREALEAEKKSAARNEKERQKAVEESRTAISATEKKLAEKLESIAREARNRSDNQLRLQRIVWSVTLGAILIGIVLVGFLVSKNRARVMIFPAKKKEEEILDILINPGLDSVKNALERKQEQRFILYLNDGRQFECVAKLAGKPGSDPVVYIEGDPQAPVAWDKRRQRAAKISSFPMV